MRRVSLIFILGKCTLPVTRLGLWAKECYEVVHCTLEFFFLNLFKIEVQLTYNVVLISAIQQSDSVIYILFFLTNILFHYGLSQDTENSSVCYIAGPCCLSVLYIKAWICYSQPSTPSLFLPPPPWQPPVSSLCPWFYFCFTDRFICVIF